MASYGEKTEAVKPDVVHREGGFGARDNDSDDLTQHEDELQRRVSRRPSAAVNVIQNPLQRHAREKVVADAEDFARTHDLEEHAALFGRAALVARDQKNFQSVAELSEEERHALQYERDHKWHGSKMMWFSITLCAVGAATQGTSLPLW